MTSTSLDKFFSGARSVGRDARSATATAVAGGEMMKAAGDVIAARMEILAAGMADPRKTDLKEISLMSSEKVEALSESAASLTRNLGALGDRLSQSAADEMALAGKAAGVMASASTPQAFAAAQYDYALGWWSRAAGQMLTLNSEMLKAQAEALKPVHDTAVANAKRLKR
ncbi:hypothetical protein BH09PSE1_BH09PSE1_19570 [soil metagenome]